jgi:predicted RNase H-like HicB family nuclease
MNYTVIIKEDKLDGGYFAYVPELKGCFTEADTLEELDINIQEAISVSTEDNSINEINKKVVDVKTSTL